MPTDTFKPLELKPKKNLKKPFYALVIGTIIFLTPFLSLLYEYVTITDGTYGQETGWGTLILGFFMWPIGLAIGIPSLIILIKRKLQQ